MAELHTLTAILPCSSLDASAAFYAGLGFHCEATYPGYRLLTDGKGANLHLNSAVEGMLAPGHNPFGLYFYAENINELAAALGPLLLHPPEHKPWGMYEFALSDPDGTLVRVGWPSKHSLRAEIEL